MPMWRKKSSQGPRLLCHHCGGNFRLEDLHYCCWNKGCNHHKGISFGILAGRKEAHRQNIPDLLKQRCPEDGYPLRPVCPNGHDMTWSFISFGTKVLGIVGAYHAGKSVYMASLYHVLKYHYGKRYNCSVMIFPQEGSDEFYDRIYKPLFVDHVMPDKTSKISHPFYIGLGPNGNWPPTPVCIILYDFPGEMAWQVEKMQEMGYLLYAEKILLLIDPYSVPSLRDSLPALDQSVMDQIKAHPEEAVLKNSIEFFRAAGFFDSRSQKIEKDLTVVIPKADLLEEVITSDEANEMFRTEGHRGNIGVKDLKQTSETCKSFLEKIGLKESIINSAENFREVTYFVVSALGQQPEELARLGIPGVQVDPQPVAVEYPILWMINKGL